MNNKDTFIFKNTNYVRNQDIGNSIRKTRNTEKITMTINSYFNYVVCSSRK